MTNMSRRSVAKGAAWAVPAVAVASSAPAVAASGFVVDCATSAANVKMSFTGASWSKVANVKGADKTGWKDTGAIAATGTTWNIQSGNPSTTAPNGDTTITGVRWFADNTRQAVVRTAAGVVGTGDITGQGVLTPQVVGPGLSTSFTIQTTVPYVGVCPNAAETLKSISIPIKLTWLRGLSGAESTGCDAGLWLNYCYNVTPGGLGCYPLLPLANASSITTTPQALC